MAATGARETISKIMNDAATNLNIPEKDRSLFNERFFNSVNIEIMIERMVTVYDKHFNDGEVKDMQWFYATATGQKVIRESPIIYKECYELGLQWIAEEALKIPPRHPGNCKKPPGTGPCIGGQGCHDWDPKVGCTWKPEPAEEGLVWCEGAETCKSGGCPMQIPHVEDKNQPHNANCGRDGKLWKCVPYKPKAHLVHPEGSEFKAIL